MAVDEALLDKLTNDPDFLKLSEADQDQMYEELSGLHTKPSMGRQIINTVFTPANAVRSGVTTAMTGAQNVVNSLPGGSAVVEGLKTLGPFAPMGSSFPAALLAKGGPEVAGALASMPFDPTTYVGGAALSIPNRIARMVASGVVGAASPALQSYGKTGDALSDPLSVALGGTLGTVGGALAKVKPKAVMTGEGSPVEFQSPPEIPITTAQKAKSLQAIREGFLSTRKIAGDEFEQGLNRLAEQNPDQRVDLSGVVKQLQDAEVATQGVKSAINRAIRTNKHAAFVSSILSQDPSVSADLSIQEAQAFKRTLQDALRNKFNQFAPDLNDVHLELLDAYHGTRVAQLEAFPEMQDVLTNYRKQLSRFRVLKPLFKEGQLSGAIMGELAEEPEIRMMANQLLPEATLEKIGWYRRTQQVTDLATLKPLRTLLGRGR